MTIRVGRITSVIQNQDARTIRVSVRTAPSQYHEEIPFTTSKTGLWEVPREGDVVEVHEVGVESYVARTPHSQAPAAMPAMEPGDFCLRLNDSTELFFNKQGDGTYDLSISTDGNVEIATDGNVEVASEGDVGVVSGGTVDVTASAINIGADGGDYKPVARKGDSVTDGTIDGGSSNVNSS